MADLHHPTPASAPPADSKTTRITIPYIREDVHQLLMWEDPMKSGMVFGGITLVSALLFFSGLPLVSLIAYTVGTAVVFFALWARFGKTVGKPMPELPPILREGISEADWKQYADKAKPHVDKCIGYLHTIVTAKDFVFSAKVAGAAFVIGKAFAMIPVFWLSYLAVVVAFTVPKFYEQNQEKIDELLATIKEESNKVFCTVKDQVNKTVHQVPALAKLFGQKTA